MATQGLVTVRHGDRVVMKIVAGSNGMKAGELAQRLQVRSEIPSLEEAYNLATEVGFGSEQCLVVITETGELYKGDGEVSLRYRHTFDQPQFNPRWEHGTADHIAVVDL